MAKSKHPNWSPEREKDWQLICDARDAGHNDALAYERLLSHLERWPKSVAALSLLSDWLVQHSRFKEAESVIRRGLREAHPKIRWIFEMRKAELSEEVGDFNSAARWYRRAIRSNRPIWSGLYVYLGCVLAKQGKFDDAKRAHRRAISLCMSNQNPKDADEPYYNLALIYRIEGKYKQALGYANRAIELDPKYVEAKQVRRDLLNTIAYLQTAKCTKSVVG